jgi:hypothetical protein
VTTDQDVSVAVHLQQVPVQRVEPESPHRERVVVLEVQDGLWIAEGHEALLEQVKTQNLDKFIEMAFTFQSVTAQGVTSYSGDLYSARV